jgi:hypothetical protein
MIDNLYREHRFQRLNLVLNGVGGGTSYQYGYGYGYGYGGYYEEGHGGKKALPKQRS